MAHYLPDATTPPPALTPTMVVYKERGPDYACLPHIHMDFQWYCVLDGEVEMVVEGISHRLSANMSILIPPGAVRAPRCAGHAPKYIVALFRDDRLALADCAGRVMGTPAELRPDLAALARDLRMPGPNCGELIGALLVRLIIGLRRASQAPYEDGLDRNTALVRRVEEVLRRNLHKKVTRQDVGAELKLSPAHLARTYRNHTGKTMGRRLRELRIQRAADLLGDPTISVTQVAIEVGFSSFSHFSKTFKQEVGRLPSEYRRMS